MWSDKACILGCFTKPVDRELVDIHQALVPQGKFMEMRMFTSQIWRVCQETYRVLKQHIFFAMSIVSYIILDGKQVTFFFSCHVDFSARDQKRKPSPGRSSLARCMFWRVRRIPNLKRSRRSSFRAKDKQSECNRRAKHKQSGCRRPMNCVSAWSRASNEIQWRPRAPRRSSARSDLRNQTTFVQNMDGTYPRQNYIKLP